MITLLAFVAAIVLLVVFHEYGHYWVARRCGVKVLRFSVGFGTVIYSKRFASSATEWVISAIPLGGYVKMVDEREEEVAPEDLQFSFNRKPVLQRMAIVVAGPLANFLLAIALYWVLFMYGIPGLKPVLGDVPPGSPAALAQLQSGETIISINGVAIPSWQELRWRMLDMALQQGRVNIEAVNISGITMTHTLDLSSLKAQDIEGEFLDKLGLRLYQPVVLPVLGNVVEGSVAQRAGLRAGDAIVRANGMTMQHWSQVVEVVRAHPEQAVQLEVQRGEIMLDIAVTPQAVVESRNTVGKIGAAPQVDKAAWQAMTIEVSYAPVEAISQALRKTWETSVISVKMLGRMVLGEVSMKNISGPITIADYAGARQGKRSKSGATKFKVATLKRSNGATPEAMRSG